VGGGGGGFWLFWGGGGLGGVWGFLLGGGGGWFSFVLCLFGFCWGVGGKKIQMVKCGKRTKPFEHLSDPHLPYSGCLPYLSEDQPDTLGRTTASAHCRSTSAACRGAGALRYLRAPSPKIEAAIVTIQDVKRKVTTSRAESDHPGRERVQKERALVILEA